MHCRNWGVGKSGEWCGGTRTCQWNTLRRTRIGWAKCKWWRSEFMAQIRHSARNEKAPASLQGNNEFGSSAAATNAPIIPWGIPADFDVAGFVRNGKTLVQP